MTDTTQSLANELASLNVPEQTEVIEKAKKTKKADEVKTENTEAAVAPDNLITVEELLAQVEALKAEKEALTTQLNGQDEPEEEEGEPSELFYEGIKHPDYRLKTVYVPFHAQGVSKANGYDHETGESYVYTIVKMAHKPPGSEFHRMETYNIRLDSRVVVPAFVAEALGTRADAQEYFG